MLKSRFTFATVLYITYQERQREWPDEALATFPNETEKGANSNPAHAGEISQIHAQNIFTIFKALLIYRESFSVFCFAKVIYQCRFGFNINVQKLKKRYYKSLNRRRRFANALKNNYAVSNDRVCLDLLVLLHQGKCEAFIEKNKKQICTI